MKGSHLKVNCFVDFGAGYGWILVQPHQLYKRLRVAHPLTLYYDYDGRSPAPSGGGLIHTAAGNLGGVGIPFTKRSGYFS